MKQEQFKTILAGGFATRLPQAPDNAGIAQNLTIDKETGGWSTRVGYEPYKVGATDWTPFGSCGAVYSLHAAQELASGARQSLLFEEGGNLHLLYDASGTILLRTLATGRHIPTPTEAGSWYTDTGYGTVITNGVDRPVIVRPWPWATRLTLPTASLAASAPSASTPPLPRWTRTRSTRCPLPLQPALQVVVAVL